MKYQKPEIVACYSADDLKKLIIAEACSTYSNNCGCHGGPQKL